MTSHLEEELKRVHKRISQEGVTDDVFNDTILVTDRALSVAQRANRMRLRREESTGNKDFRGQFRIGGLLVGGKKLLDTVLEKAPHSK